MKLDWYRWNSSEASNLLSSILYIFLAGLVLKSYTYIPNLMPSSVLAFLNFNYCWNLVNLLLCHSQGRLYLKTFEVVLIFFEVFILLRSFHFFRFSVFWSMCSFFLSCLHYFLMFSYFFWCLIFFIDYAFLGRFQCCFFLDCLPFL